MLEVIRQVLAYQIKLFGIKKKKKEEYIQKKECMEGNVLYERGEVKSIVLCSRNSQLISLKCLFSIHGKEE